MRTFGLGFASSLSRIVNSFVERTSSPAGFADLRNRKAISFACKCEDGGASISNGGASGNAAGAWQQLPESRRHAVFLSARLHNKGRGVCYSSGRQ